MLLGVAVNGAYLFFCAFGGASEGGQPPYLAASRPPRLPPIHVRRAPSTAAPRVVSYYAPQANQTSVYPAEDLTLIAEPGRTLLLSPIFSVPGSEAAAPPSVLLRFYSFSRAQQYAPDSLVWITVDGKDVWPGAKALHSITRDTAGEVVESLGSEVPYGVFVKVARGRVVKIILGREVVELSGGQLEALRDMLRCAEAGACG